MSPVKILRIHLVEIVAAILFVVLVLFFYQGNKKLLDTTEDMSYSKDWVYVAQEATREYETLPESIEAVGETGEIVLRKQLPENIASINSICFYTSHQLVEVYIGQKLVRSKKQNTRQLLEFCTALGRVCWAESGGTYQELLWFQ